MTVGHFRKLTSDLPDNFRVTLAISPDVIPEWIKDVTVQIVRQEEHLEGEGPKRIRIVLHIDPDD